MSDYSLHSEMHNAVFNDDIETVRRILAQGYRCQDYVENPVFERAIIHGHQRIISELLINGAEINPPRSDEYLTFPLGMAIMIDRMDIFDMLLAAGADINHHLKDENRDPRYQDCDELLLLACSHSQANTVARLLDMGLIAHSKHIETAACNSDFSKIQIVERLLVGGALPTTWALANSLLNGNLPIARRLLDLGVNPRHDVFVPGVGIIPCLALCMQNAKTPVVEWLMTNYSFTSDDVERAFSAFDNDNCRRIKLTGPNEERKRLARRLCLQL